ncbi:MAG TPA: sigma-70 family RNA polymerase sigma factor [Pyrinomonadaceae bacterium]|nr:sigma-70 family RNA polymerase sigma factor [Pyrinomonadaceae bacterium]
MNALETPSGQSARNQEIAALIKRAAAGDQLAVSELYDATSRMVYGLVLRILGDEAAAEEVLLDVYMQVWRQAGSYDAKRGAPLAWLATIARSRAIDRLRAGRQEWQRARSLETVSQLSTGENLEEAAYVTELRKVVRGALGTLSAEQREALELAYYGGLSHSEIAERLGQPLGTIKTRIRLGMIKLRALLKPEYARGL